MSSENLQNYSVAVIGAGPAGLFAARLLAQTGVRVSLLNRDVKAGGLAEYGIYPSKLKMKDGLRKQFRQILDNSNIEYFGNVNISREGELTFADLQAMGFDAILVTVGAQGTKWLGLPGEELEGVYHAKDLVYHYNKLPPFSQQRFSIGKRVLCVGVGNVMLDIAHWVVRELKVDEIVAIARRGPADVKFTKKEMETVARNLDLPALDAEIERCAPITRAVGQDPEAAKAFMLSALDHAEEPVSQTRFRFEFLASPHRIVADEQGRVSGLEVEDTTLVARPDGGSNAVGLGTFRVIEGDTVVFCIGDRVDETFGLPLDKWGDFAKDPHPRFPIDGLSYEAYDPQTQQPIEGVFLAGWSREASTGLVGTARKDGELAAQAVTAYLREKQPRHGQADAALSAKSLMLSEPVVHKQDLRKLENVENAKSAELGLPEFKFSSNDEMLNAIGLKEAKPI
jgi:ferredoxin/flavodoxin---NADP+ reductase